MPGRVSGLLLWKGKIFHGPSPAVGRVGTSSGTSHSEKIGESLMSTIRTWQPMGRHGLTVTGHDSAATTPHAMKTIPPRRVMAAQETRAWR